MFVQDLASFILTPLLAVSIGRTVKGWHRALVPRAGMAVFAAYYFSSQGIGKIYTVLCLVYSAISGLGTYSFLGLFGRQDPAALDERSGDRPPV